MVFEVHRILTAGTLDDEAKTGVFRTAGDPVRVEDHEGEIMHLPPPASELPERMAILCAFANARSDTKDSFVHPLVRAILVHFMLAYDHPFVDGNGRTARALFYWCALRNGFRLLEYVSISAVMKRAPVKYGLAFLHTETDGGDTTCFLIHQVKVIQDALAALEEWVRKKQAELSILEKRLIESGRNLNARQRALLLEAGRRPGLEITIAIHQKQHRVSYLTARADLEGLAELKLFAKRKRGQTSIYTPRRTCPCVSTDFDRPAPGR